MVYENPCEQSRQLFSREGPARAQTPALAPDFQHRQPFPQLLARKQGHLRVDSQSCLVSNFPKRLAHGGFDSVNPLDIAFP
jgi:hypothetical protein